MRKNVSAIKMKLNKGIGLGQQVGPRLGVLKRWDCISCHAVDGENIIVSIIHANLGTAF